MVTPQETFVRYFCLGYGAQVVVVVGGADTTTLTQTGGRALVDELPSHQRINFADHCALAHAEILRDGVRARPALALFAHTGNQVGVDLELVGVQAQKEDVVVELKIGYYVFHIFFPCFPRNMSGTCGSANHCATLL